MAYVPPQGGEVDVELSSSKTYDPPTANAFDIEFAASDDGPTGKVSYVTVSGSLTLLAIVPAKYTVAHEVPVASLTLQGYPPTSRITKHNTLNVSGSLSLLAQGIVTKAQTLVDAPPAALTLTAYQPTYFLGYVQNIAVVGNLALTGNAGISQLSKSPISAPGTLQLQAQEISLHAKTALNAVGGLTLQGWPPIGQKSIVSKAIDSVYFSPSVTIDVFGTLALHGYPPSQWFRVYKGVDGSAGLMGSVYGVIVGVCADRIHGIVDAPYAIQGGLYKAVDSSYSIKNTNEVRNAIVSPYGFPTVSAIDSLYSLIQNVQVQKAIDSLYSYMHPVYGVIGGDYDLALKATSAIVSVYSLLPANIVYGAIEAVYSFPHSQIISITEPPYLLYKGNKVPIEEAEVSIAEGDFSWKCTVVLTNVQDYVQLKYNDPFTIVIGVEQFDFIVDNKELDRNAPPNYGMRLTGVSPSEAFTSPRKLSEDYAWEQYTFAKAIAEELLPGIDWRVLDWPIPAFRFAAQGTTPIEAVRTLSGVIGATLESNPDGTLYVRSKYPVSVPDYPTATIYHSFLESTDIIRVNESYISTEIYNRLIISDIEQEISDSLEWIEDYQDAVTGVIRAYLYPWRSGVQLVHTGVASVSIAAPTVVMEQHEEILEVFQNEGSTSYPIHHIDSITYEAQNVGALIFDMDSRSFTVSGPSFNSVIRLVYWTRSLDYRVAMPEARPTQFILESQPL